MNNFINLTEFLVFLIGFAFSTFLMLNVYSSIRTAEYNQRIKSDSIYANKFKHVKNILSNFKNEEFIPNPVSYENKLADHLFNEVRVLCWVFTHPANHKTKVPHVRETWGKKCNKLLFMSIEADLEQPDIIALPILNGRSHLWNKTRLAMKYVYENYFNDAEWFMRADDDNFILMENLRYKLYQYNPRTSIYIGHRFAVDYQDTPEGYMAGGGHIFSKKALEKFVTIISPNSSICDNKDGEADDLLVGKCLKEHAIFIDARDSFNQKQIFPVGIEEHVNKPEILDLNYWYWRNLWRNVSQGGLECCSDVYIGCHYVSPVEMYALQYMIYDVHPFGLSKNLTEKLPRKLNLTEIVNASDVASYSPNFRLHEHIHYFDDDERY
ncbi:unnamed protein product [Chironomus riparius]|uniref:N-acetylgalactosaminide beta-1,3-galactosyltransferase n=1 Tax=Chironomus riparius TaxID=315576 RepID=A0A9N9WQZ6_9DIPT|nr:unnamed protein product [Chironomus riparius]